MGYSGKLAEKQTAQSLRSQGLSYGEIQKVVKVSKDTLSQWCRDIKLTSQQKTRLINNKSLGQKRGSLVAAENKRASRIRSVNEAIVAGASDLGDLSFRDKFIAGLALYIAEGTKRDGHIAFSNADPRLILFMSTWFREYLQCEDNKLRARIWIHENLDENNAIEFWSGITKIPQRQFIKTYVVKNKINSNKVRKNIHEFGVCTVYFSSVQKHRQLMGWIYALFNDRITSTIDPR